MDEIFKPIDLNDAYMIGIDSVDQEHRFLIGIYNDLIAKIASSHAEDLVDGIVRKLFDYADYHFASEERVMVTADFPGLDAHRLQHESFVRSLNDLVTDRSGDKVADLRRVAFFVGTWIRGHILVTDKQLGEFVASRYQSPRPSAG